jgi:hypothetical protein
MLGRFQRSAQTVSGTASGYTNRFYFEDVVEDYYAIPERIKAITKTRIINTADCMYEESVWALGVLGSPGRLLVDALSEQISVLWNK